VAGEIDELVRQWARVLGGADRSELERKITAAAHRIAFRAAKSTKLSDSNAEEVAQDACEKLARFLDGGGRFESNADGWVWRTASNGARDIQRGETQQRIGFAGAHREALAAPHHTASPESLWLEEERQRHVRAVIGPLVEKAPTNYREVLRRHFFEDVPIEDLASERFRAMADAGEFDQSDPEAVASARRKARNIVDQHLKRGRDWLRKRLAKLGEEGEL
jgi:DNA-directed RNA polymerase specialized sigma24 family protein